LTWRSVWFGCVVALAALSAASVPASAHPLGNFTINHLSVIAPGPDRVRVRYVLDMAEIPTYALMREREPSGRMSAPQLAAWAREWAAQTAPQLTLTVDGRVLALSVDAASAKTRPGAGGLPTLYAVADFAATVATSRSVRTLAYRDDTFSGRLGWRDAIVLPQTEPTHQLTAYPNALLASPRNVTSLVARVEPNGTVRVDAASEPAAAAPAPSAVRSNQLADMLVASRGPWFVALTLLVAVLLGALHALEPGHGKTLLAVSLVGARATWSQAAILAAALTFAHTAGVLFLGVAIIALKGAFVPADVYPWITLLSGVAVAIVGARALQRQIAARFPFAHEHAHQHDGAHEHAHAHEHHVHDGHAHGDREHGHSHAIPGTAPLRFGPTVWAAMSGGVAPCPAALVVLFAALAQNVLAYGIVAIVFFSLGLAATLTGLGIAVVRGAGWLSKRPQFDRVAAFAPLASALAIAAIGAVMVGQGVVERGAAATPFYAAGLTALAIAAYAFSHPFSHRHAEVA